MHLHDEHQKRIIDFCGDAALVLAGPGCGKTHVLARRIIVATCDSDIDPAGMMCVTFTNRAAREMKQRIAEYAGYVPLSLFVGNMHRFCLRFLTVNELIEADTSVLDEEDRNQILATILPDTRAAAINSFLNKAAYVYQKENDHPWWIMHTPVESITIDDYEAIKQYSDFKRDNRLLDYDDILLMTYTALMQADRMDYAMTGYSWIQVDEVQDMTPLQLAIVEAVSRKMNRTIVYLGDEQQAIFNFTGAGGRALEPVKAICRHNIFRLTRNYRSPKLLVEMCNRLAVDWLEIPKSLLPSAVGTDFDGSLTMHRCYTTDDAALMSAHICRQLAAEHPDEKIAVLVRSNKEGERVAEVFESVGLEAFHISRNDLFHCTSYKTVWSHLAAVSLPHLSQPWSRLLYQTKAVKTLSGARKTVKILTDSGINPSELLSFEMPTCTEVFCHLVSGNRTIVVFDTETTGLDVYSDDIVQIAAVKVRGGRIVPGSEFEVFIHTDKPLPTQLASGHPNTFVRTYAHAEKIEAEAAFKEFFDYIGNDSVLCGHNITFDRAIIYHNIQRRTQLDIPTTFSLQAPSIDTLALARLTMPRLMSHTLENLIKVFGTEGQNNHNALDDATATANLIAPLYDLARKFLPQISAVKQSKNMQTISQRFCKAYGRFYGQSRLALNNTALTPDNTLSGAFIDAAGFFHTQGFIDELPRLDYITELIDNCIVAPGENSFHRQVSEHLFELLSFNEADLFVNGIVREQISITTVHKAKGLEMDNVVVNNASNSFGKAHEHARVLYVAFSRAKKRLAVGLAGNVPPCVRSVEDMFEHIHPQHVETALHIERSHKLKHRSNN